jgi:hypothetical protein
MRGLRRQLAREVPQGYPRFGYMLDHKGAPVGVLLALIFDTRQKRRDLDLLQPVELVCLAAVRNYAPMLTSIAPRLKDRRTGPGQAVSDDADCWPDELRLSDIEDRFVCTACGKRGRRRAAGLQLEQEAGREWKLSQGFPHGINLQYTYPLGAQ